MRNICKSAWHGAVPPATMAVLGSEPTWALLALAAAFILIAVIAHLR